MGRDKPEDRKDETRKDENRKSENRKKHYFKKPEGFLNHKQRKAAARRADHAAKEAKRQISLQRDRWVDFQAYSSEDEFWQPVRLWLEYLHARKVKSTSKEMRDNLDLVFKQPSELESAWTQFENERIERGRELGKRPDEYFDEDMYVSSALSGATAHNVMTDDVRADISFVARRFKRPFQPAFHDWKWWSALSTLEEDIRPAFFSDQVEGYDNGSLPVFKAPPTISGETVCLDLQQAREFEEHWRDLKAKHLRAREAMDKALAEQQRLADLFSWIGEEAEEAEEAEDVEDATVKSEAPSPEG